MEYFFILWYILRAAILVLLALTSFTTLIVTLRRLPSGKQLTTGYRVLLSLGGAAALTIIGAWLLNELATRPAPRRQLQPSPYHPALLFQSESAVRTLTFSPDDARLAAGFAGPPREAVNDSTIRVWDMTTRQALWSVGTQGVVDSLAFLPDGMTIATNTMGSFDVLLWDTTSGHHTGTLAREMEPGRSGILQVAVSPNGRWLAAAEYFSVAIWDMADSALLTVLPQEASDGGLEFSPDGAILAVAHSGQVTMWETSGWTQASTLAASQAVRDMAFSGDSRYLATGSSQDETATVWDLRTGEPLFTAECKCRYVRSVALSPDGSLLVLGHFLGNLSVWTVLTGELIAVDSTTPEMIMDVAFNHAGDLFATGSIDGAIRLWDPAAFTNGLAGDPTAAPSMIP